MTNSTRTWQLISLALAVALVAALAEQHGRNTARPPTTNTLPTANNATDLEHLALSPTVRRIHERYSL